MTAFALIRKPVGSTVGAVMRAPALGLINFYQHYLSPYKGFCCAYRARTGRRSCSAYAKAVVARLGVHALFDAMPRQFARCKAAYASLSAAATMPNGEQKEERRKKWWDNCDCNPLNCADLPCDCSP